MNIRLTMGLVLMLGLLLAPVVRAEPPTDVQIEISFLLGFIDGSSCEFYRNGSWYDSKKAQEHIRGKYKYLLKKDLIKTTDDFIEGAATKSSMSGKPYAVRCNNGAQLTSNEWLRDELARFRKF